MFLGKSSHTNLKTSTDYVELINDDVMEMLSHFGDTFNIFKTFVDCGKILETDLDVNEKEDENEIRKMMIG